MAGGLGWRAGVVAAAAGMVMLTAGCGTGERAAVPAAAAGFGRTQAQSEVDRAVATAGLPESALSKEGAGPFGATPTASPSTDRERLAVRMGACAAGWQRVGPETAGARGKFDAAVAALTRAGWTAGERREEKPDPKGSAVTVTLKKRGWTLLARHYASSSFEVLSLMATEDSCMAGFTEREVDLLSGGEGQPKD